MENEANELLLLVRSEGHIKMATPSVFSPTLTQAQRDAITHAEGPLLIVAGPGTGKTDVIVRRTAYLVLEGGVDPENILVTTFTNKAADELYDRLWPLLGRKAQRLHISTIHSFCQTILTNYPDHNPWGRTFEVLDDRDQFLFIYSRLRELGLNRFPKGRLGEFLADVKAAFSLCTEELIDPAEFRRVAGERGAELLGLKKKTPEAVEEYVAVAEAYGRYVELLRGEGLLDFAMLQRVAYEMARSHENVRSELSNRFRHILVDEYQDTNRLQVLLLCEIAKPKLNVCAVGDDDQSIYRFRGASVSSFLGFEKDFPNAKTVKLDMNFRATPSLVEATSALIVNNAPHRREKTIAAFRDSPAYGPVLVHAETCAEEADQVVQAIARARSLGFIESYNDVAFLFRSVKYHAQDYLEAMDRYGVPYRVGADGQFFDREDVLHLKDLITFCGWKQKWDPRVFEGKLLALGPSTIEAIRKWKEDPAQWMEEEALSKLGVSDPGERRVLQRLATIRCRTQSDEARSLLDVFYELLEATGYMERCCRKGPAGDGDTEAEAALLNLAQFSSLVSSFQRLGRTQNTYRFGEYLRTIRSRSLDSLRPEPVDEAVRVMTVHQAKGLEFPVVVIGSAMNGRFPSRFRPAKYPVPAELRLSGERDDKEEDIRDQRRLFYVAATRAETLLIIGASDKVNTRGGGRSRYIDEIGDSRFNRFEFIDEPGKTVEKRQKTLAPARRRLSYSAIHSYLLCPLQYKLLYHCDFVTPEAHWFDFGRIIHQALEILHTKARVGEDITPATASLILDTVWRVPPYWAPQRATELKETGRDYLIRYVQNHRDRLDRIRWVEEPVDFHLDDDMVITGRIDLACETTNGLEIIDFKVRSRKGLDVLRPDLQVQTYGLACQEARAETIDKVVIHLLAEQPGSEIEAFSWNDEVSRKAKDVLQRAVEGMRSNRFQPTPSAYCTYCDFHGMCPTSEQSPGTSDPGEAPTTVGATFL